VGVSGTERAGAPKGSRMRRSSPPFAIGDLACQVGLTPRTIRYYEDIGLLNSIRRVESGRRIYTEEDVRRLRFIKRLKVLGLSLEEMKELESLYLTHRSNERVLPRLLELLDRHMETLDARIEQLRILKQDIEGYRDHIREKL
jgi:MerR family transcriptional regulator, repressor of the yfmOP operon